MIIPVAGPGTVSGRAWQRRAWSLYGDPDSDRPGVGEMRYAVGFIAQQCGRIIWTVTPEGDDEPIDQPEADELLTAVAVERSIRQTTVQAVTNLLVAGQFTYVGVADADADADAEGEGSRDRWEIVSTADKRARSDLEANMALEVIWSHPAKPEVPDPPVRGILDPLDDLEKLGRLSRSQSLSRMAAQGMWVIANEYEGVTDPANRDKFQEDMRAAAESAVDDVDDPAQVVGPMLFGNADLVERDTVRHVRDVRPYDDRLDAKMRFAIERVANGFPLPREVLLGMTATNRATAFQIEDAAYRAHIEPIAAMVADMWTAVLNAMSPGTVYVVEADPSDLLARRHSVADAKDAWDRGLVAAWWVREQLGIPEDAAATPEDLALLTSTGTTVREPDPAEEAVAGAPPAGTNLESLSSELTIVDHDLRVRLHAAGSMAIDRALDRLGAQLRQATRRDPAIQARIDGAANQEVPGLITDVELAVAGVDVAESVAVSLRPLRDWWVREATEASETVRGLIGEPDLQWTQPIETSALLLVDEVAALVLADPASPLMRHDLVDRVLAVAGGADLAGAA